ncbi:MAG: peptidyl-alpha-hydroxyglycine alpha-amidating lyase family protein [Opitutaceae bacterium]
MNAVRARSFTHAALDQLTRVANWPRLPPEIKLERVSGIAVDSRGRVYVAHRGEHPLLRLHPDGALDCEIGAELMHKSLGYDLRTATPVPMEVRHWLHGLHLDPWDNVWVTDVGRHLVRRFNADGALTLTLGTDGATGCDATHFYQPTHVCVLPTGDFFVTDGYGNSRVAKFSASGKLLFAWGTRGTAPGEFHTPHVATLTSSGLLAISDRENDRVQLFDPDDGGLRAEWPGLHSVDGLHTAPDGTLYGAAGLDSAVIEFAPDGRTAQVWAEPGLFTYPHGIGADASGALYIAEISGDRVLKLQRKTLH